METLGQKDKLTMTKKELDRIVVINRLVRKEITQEEAAILAKVSTRQIRRMFKRHGTYGDEGVISRRSNNNRAFSWEFKDRTISLVLSKCGGTIIKAQGDGGKAQGDGEKALIAN